MIKDFKNYKTSNPTKSLDTEPRITWILNITCICVLRYNMSIILTSIQSCVHDPLVTTSNEETFLQCFLEEFASEFLVNHDEIRYMSKSSTTISVH